MNQDPDMQAPVPVHAVPVDGSGNMGTDGMSNAPSPRKSSKTLVIVVSCVVAAVIVAAGVLLFLALSDTDPDDDGSVPRNGQVLCYGAHTEITCPTSSSEAFYFQDADTDDHLSYTDNGDETVSDARTGLIW
ncbi:hypothetical protein KIPB_008469 [Kipferlia bialata]|uniref:Uncharacterized protein n=1 Tax=Kipferlia bialata TaxID=797122 RepID=A0A9K3D003_9EUKA|nr:hypothetical protein KIPB_008469 [Kipferlia bialata]|eukprot:g8469.t1